MPRGRIMLVPFTIFTVFCFVQEAGNRPNQATAPTDEPSSVTAELPFTQKGGWVSRWMDKETSPIMGSPYSSWFCASWQAYVLCGSQQGHTVVHVADPASTSRCFLGNAVLLSLRRFSSGASQRDDEVPGCCDGKT